MISKKKIRCFLKQTMQIWIYICLKNHYFVTPDWAILIPPERHWCGDFIFSLLGCSLACFKCKNFGAHILASFASHSNPYYKLLPAACSARNRRWLSPHLHVKVVTNGSWRELCLEKEWALAGGSTGTGQLRRLHAHAREGGHVGVLSLPFWARKESKFQHTFLSFWRPHPHL